MERQKITQERWYDHLEDEYEQYRDVIARMEIPKLN